MNKPKTIKSIALLTLLVGSSVVSAQNNSRGINLDLMDKSVKPNDDFYIIHEDFYF